MPKNLMCSAHKATNKNYRDKYDRIFKQVQKIKMFVTDINGKQIEVKSIDNFELNINANNQNP